jgi:hypothetical protein
MPLVEAAAERAQITAAIRDLAAGLEAWHAANPAAVGVAGDHALLRAYLAKDGTLDDPDDVAGRALASALDRVGQGGFGLFGGMAHDAWLVAHLTDEDALGAALETALSRALTPASDLVDLIGGIAGVGLYAVERRSASLAARVVDRLEALAQPCGDALVWRAPGGHVPDDVRAQLPADHVDLGLAHGVPGVIAVLARMSDADLEIERAARLVDGAVAYLRVPRAVTPRVSWCHGHLGIALALHAAAHARRRDDWRAEAHALALGIARRLLDDAGVIDAGMCHGSAGAAHLLHRLHRATGDAEIGLAARAWLDRTLASRRDGAAIAGFPAHRFELGWQPAAEILSGAAGVALALHASISELEPSWDRLFLADLEVCS